jgi:5-methylcytosine-specific restriction endonuclease McrA
VEYQYINRTKVFERDGWRCQMCGKATPKYRKGTRYPNAPELDHRTPLALGGPHTYANTQCACRACNAAKGATASIGQLPLIEAWGGGGQGPQQIAAHRAPKAF